VIRLRHARRDASAAVTPALAEAGLRRTWLIPAVAGLSAAAACGGRQSALAPSGPLAHQTTWVWWFFFGVCAVVYALTLAALVLAVVRARGNRRELEADSARRMAIGVGSATVLTVLLLFVLLAASVATGRAIGAFGRSSSVVTLTVTGHQWWWEVAYDAATPSDRITTANEIHVPVGEPVLVHLESRDVIHSFWVPNLHGKRDAIPGYRSQLWLQADRPGIHRGQCAEFCGNQHAKMGLLVVAEPRPAFEAWLAAQRRPAPEPVTDAARRGRDVFVSGPCAMCHTVLGTPAGGRAGPDLTHVASRRTIGAASLPNTRGHLAGWIVDPHVAKPGVRMPATLLEAADLQALLAYLETLR
jgi:cytochrome c oxidase subunit 2